MKHKNFNSKLFSEIVSYLERIVEHPYLKEFDVGNYSELAYALNHKGIRNSRGENLTNETIKKCIQRVKNKEDYFPEILTKLNNRKPSTWDFIVSSDSSEVPSKSEVELDRFTHAVISANQSHFYGERTHV